VELKKDDKVVYTVKENDYFGELSLLNNPNVLSAVASVIVYW